MNECKNCEHYIHGLVCDLTSRHQFCGILFGKHIDEFIAEEKTAAIERRIRRCSNADCQVNFVPKEKEKKRWWQKTWTLIIKGGRNE